jgi:hypothetical protein
VQKKGFWIGCRAHFCVVLVRRNSAGSVPQRSLPHFFPAWGGGCGNLEPSTFLPTAPLADACRDLFNHLSPWGKGRSDGKEGQVGSMLDHGLVSLLVATRSGEGTVNNQLFTRVRLHCPLARHRISHGRRP